MLVPSVIKAAGSSTSCTVLAAPGSSPVLARPTAQRKPATNSGIGGGRRPATATPRMERTRQSPPTSGASSSTGLSLTTTSQRQLAGCEDEVAAAHGRHMYRHRQDGLRQVNAKFGDSRPGATGHVRDQGEYGNQISRRRSSQVVAGRDKS